MGERRNARSCEQRKEYAMMDLRSLVSGSRPARSGAFMDTTSRRDADRHGRRSFCEVHKLLGNAGACAMPRYLRELRATAARNPSGDGPGYLSLSTAILAVFA